jgi:adenylate kinase
VAAFVAARAGREVATLTIDSAAHSLAPAENFLPGPVLLLGAPGVGKGTQAQLLMNEFGIPQISTGDILRQNIANKTKLGLEAKVLMDQGQLVDDQIVNDMVGNRLQEPDISRGFILDGYPRTLSQAGYIDLLLDLTRKRAQYGTRYGLYLPIVAISIQVDTAELLRRITGRRICPTCKRSYNIYSQPPAKPGVCDIEGSQLQQRADDTEEAFAERMSEYCSKTAPVIAHYRNQGRFAEVDGKQSVEQVTANIKAALIRLREKD